MQFNLHDCCPRVFAFLIFISVASGVVVAADPMDIPKLARESRPAIVLLIVQNSEGTEVATGTGFFISAEGTLVTNYHVIEGGTQFVAKTETGAFYLIKEVAQKDKVHDLAILKASAKNVPFLPLGKASGTQPGEPVAVIGSPLGLEGTVSSGIVSALRDDNDDHVLQITAPISPGSSGSPVINSKGEVIGVATAFLTKGQNLNIAVPAEVVQNLASRPSSNDASAVNANQNTPSNSRVDEAVLDKGFVRASEMLNNDDAAQALKLLNQVVKRFPESPIVHFQMAFAFGKLGFHEDSIQAYRFFLKAEPDDAVAWANLAGQYLNLKQIPSAKGASETAIKLDPTLGFAWRIRGLYFAELKQFPSAIEAVERASKLAPEDQSNWKFLAALYRVTGQAAKAQQAEKHGSGTTQNLPITQKGENEAESPGNTTVNAFVQTYLQATQAGDVSGVVKSFAPKVDYMEYGAVGRTFISDDFRKLFARWPRYRITNLSGVTVDADSKSGRLTTRFTYDFSAESPKEGRWARGTAANVAVISQVDGTFQIVSIRQSVSNRSSNAKKK